ncbi:MAG: hypothetical protein DRO52_00240 [Candidatus Hecatellales archaeon]|nr:MAG: hypothetical protein DRO52_00240 [Candidatus Hecatellales archaeon]
MPELTLQVAGIGGIEWVILLAIFLIFIFGSKKMPEIMRHLGKAMGEFERSRLEIQRELMMASQTVQKPLTSIQADLAKLTPEGQPGQASPPPPPLQAEKSEVRPPTGSSSFLLRMAEELGVPTENRSEEEIWEEIRRRTLERGGLQQAAS